MNEKFSKIFGLLLVVTMIASPVVAQPAYHAVSSSTLDEQPDFQPVDDFQQVDNLNARVVGELKGATEPAIYLIMLSDAPLANYEGGITGLEATNPTARGENKLDAESSESRSYIHYLDEQRAEAIEGINKSLDRELKVVYEYVAAMNGFAAEMTPEEAAQVAALPDVLLVQRDQEFELQTDAGPTWMGAPGIWSGTDTGGLPGTLGEGVIVGVIDTGIDPWNPSFADIGGDGYDHTNPWGSGTYVGVCDSGHPSYDATFPCNDKLIGAWGYATVNGGDPRDANGHGSHTASTAAGNFVYDTVITTTAVFTADISGIAPHANVDHVRRLLYRLRPFRSPGSGDPGWGQCGQLFHRKHRSHQRSLGRRFCTSMAGRTKCRDLRGYLGRQCRARRRNYRLARRCALDDNRRRQQPQSNFP